MAYKTLKLISTLQYNTTLFMHNVKLKGESLWGGIVYKITN